MTFSRRSTEYVFGIILKLSVFSIVAHLLNLAIAEQIIILGSIEEVELGCLENQELFEASPLGKVVQILENNLFTQSYLICKDEDHYLIFKSDQLVFNYKDYFFENFFQHLASQGNFCHLPIRSYSNSVKAPLYNLLVELGDHIVKLIEYDEEIKFIDIYSLLNSSDLPIHENYKDEGELNRFKNNWFEICLTLNLIINKKCLSLSNFKGVEEKEYFNIYWFIEWYAEQNIKYFDNETIEYLFEIISKRFSQEIQETNERCDYFSNLAKIALLHQKPEYIKRYSYQCWDLILGYGWRKDVGIFEVLDSIEYLSQKNPRDALFYLQEISSEVTQILEYTDGKETRHALPQYTKLLSSLNLSCLTSKFEWEVKNGDWHNAENSFHHILSNLPNLSSLVWESICRTGLSQDDLYALQNNSDIEHAKELINIALDHNGMENLPEYIKKTENSSTNEISNTISYEDFPLEKFPDFLTWIKSDYKNRDHLLPWMEYWKAKVKKSDFIKYVWNYIKDNDLHNKDENLLLDPIYEIAKSTRGKNFAFDVLVKAQSNKGGWFNHWFESTEHTFKRLDIVAKEYKDKADDFIQLSTQNNKVLNTGLVIPSSRLVYLLIQLDRIEEAKSFIEVMIEVLKEETRNLNLQTPSWNWNANLDEHEIAIALLVTRLQWPFTSIKQWTASELSTLLTVNDTQKIVEARLLESLKSKKLESEVVEILCVFWMACQKGYHPTIVLGEYIFARSCLSDQLLKAIESKTCNYGYYQGNFDLDSGLIERESNFRKNLGSEFPLMYLSTCEDLEEKYSIPLTEYFQHEWNKTFIHEPRLHDTYQYFLERDNTGQFYTLNSHRARSAYLRVFEVAKLRYGMPEDYANFFSIKALPLETAYLNFLPSKASWFTKWDSQDEYSTESVKNYLRNLIHVCNTRNDGKILGALSFPLKISAQLQLDITCTLINPNHG